MIHERHRYSSLHDIRFILLLVMLMLLVLAAPFIESAEHGLTPRATEIVTLVLFSAMMSLAVYAVTGTRHALVTALVLAAGTFAAWMASVVLGDVWLLIAQYAMAGLFTGYCAVVILRHLFTVRRVTSNTVAASLCVYLLMAVLWSQVFGIFENLEPGSFAGPGASADGQPIFSRDHPAASLYFSLVTISTLGYGDIVPVAPHARIFAAMEAVMGQMFLAALVARLVGLHIAHGWRDEQESPGGV